MAPSSIASDFLALFALAIVCVLSLLLLRHFLPLRGTPTFLLVPIFFSLVLPISTVLLVPIDLASSTRGEDEAGRGIWLPDGALLVAWRIIYWLQFGMTLLGLILATLFVPSLDKNRSSGFKSQSMSHILSMFNPLRIFRPFIYPNVFLCVS